ncbi:MAG: transglutaminase domain-containing protein [Armatimonas sp.]
MISETPPEKIDPPSAPLYIGAGLAQFFVLMVVRFQVSDPSFAFALMLLTGIGLFTAFRMRQRGIGTSIVPAGAVVVSALFLLSLSRNSLLAGILPSEIFIGTEISVVIALALTAALSNFLAVSDDAVSFTLVWGVAIIGLSGSLDLNRELIFCFFGFLLCVAFVLVHQNYLNQARQTGPVRHISTPLVKFQFVAALAAWIFASIVGASLSIPLRALGKGISLRQVVDQLQLPRSAVGSRMGSSGGSPSLNFENRSEFRVGLGPTRDDQTEVMTVTSAHPRYWRGRSYLNYGPNGWSNPDLPVSPQPLTTKNPDADMPAYPVTIPNRPKLGKRSIETHQFELTSELLGSVFHAAEPVQLRGKFEFILMRGDGTLGGNLGSSRKYEIDSEVVEIEPDALDKSSKDYPETIRQRYLWNGPTNPALEKLVNEAVGSTSGPYSRAEAIRKFILGRCTYSLSARAVPIGIDPTLFFLNDSHEGYCDLFATATTVLCRYAGLPARIVTGFNSGTPDSNNPNLYHLRNSNRHAWTEVYFTGYGWIPFDATVDSMTSEAPPPAVPEQKLTWRDRLLDMLPRILLALGACGLLYLAGGEIRRLMVQNTVKSLPISPQAKRIGTAYRRALHATRKAGVERNATMSTAEHLSQVREHLGATVADALAPLAQLADIAVFSNRPPGEEEVAKAETHLNTFLQTLKGARSARTQKQ